MKRETEHIVAFLDLLGASQIILGERSEAVMNVISFLFTAVGHNWLEAAKLPPVLKRLKTVTFSDNIALALELPDGEKERDACVKDFVKYVSIFQSMAIKSNFLFRGGIAMGPLYMSTGENMVWGRALVEAHQLEERSAIYPRVVLSRQLERYVPGMERVRLDYDGLYFADYLPVVQKLYPDWLENTRKFIEQQYAAAEGKPGQERILQKYGWLRHYMNVIAPI